MNYPAWVEDDTPMRGTRLVRAKKVLYVLAASEKLRLMHNAGWKWVRHKALTAAEEALLAEAFPNRWPDAPTAKTFRAILADWWKPRMDEVLATRANQRANIAQMELAWVEQDGII